jgi:dTDP-4-dehydrorhamnose reductase
VVRLPLLYDLGGYARGFVARGLAAVHSTGRAYVDSFHRRFPTYVDDAARALVGLVKAGVRGTMHVSARHELSKLELMRALAPALGVDAERFRPTGAPSAPPRRPARVRLDCTRFARLGLPAPREVEDVVRHPGPYVGAGLAYRPAGREPVVTSSGVP